jgi:hypothetical protein
MIPNKTQNPEFEPQMLLAGFLRHANTTTDGILD